MASRNTYKDADETKEKEVILCKEHRDLAREAARKSFVLLKNEEKILPLGKEKKIAWVGPYVHSRNLMGAWSFIGDAKDVTNLEEAVKAQADTTNMSFHAGSPMLGSDIRLEGFGEAMEQSTTPEEEEAMLLEAVNAAKEADVVVLAIGEDRLQSGEATSNANIRIPEIQQRLLERVSKVNENVVVVLFNGRPLDLRDVVSKAKAVLEAATPTPLSSLKAKRRKPSDLCATMSAMRTSVCREFGILKLGARLRISTSSGSSTFCM